MLTIYLHIADIYTYLHVMQNSVNYLQKLLMRGGAVL